MLTALVMRVPSVRPGLGMIVNATRPSPRLVVSLGGEGLFLARLTGPGKVYLQSLPFSRLADRIAAASRFHATDERKGAAGLGGDILGSILSGRS